MTNTKKIRFALIAGLAALTVALVFNAARHFASDSAEENVSDSLPVSGDGNKGSHASKDRAEQAEETALPAPPSSDQAVEPPSQTSPNSVQGTPKQSQPKTLLGALGPDIERWLRIARKQLEAKGVQGEELEKRLEERRKELEIRDPSEWEQYLANAGHSTWAWNPHLSDRQNRIFQTLLATTGSTRYPKGSEITPPEIIEVLVEGMDDLTAAQKLYDPTRGWGWRPEREYGKMYLERALAKDPTSRDGLALKIIMSPREEKGDVARRLIELYPNDTWAVNQATSALWRDFPEETIAAIEPLFASKETPVWAHMYLSFAYERLDMMDKAVYHNGFIPIPKMHGRSPSIYPAWNFSPERRRFPSIWEERAAAAAEAAQQAAPSAESVAPGFEGPFDPRDFEPSHSHDHPDAPRGVEPPPPPPGAAMDMAAAYADFAKAYQDVFEMEYGLSEATPEGYMNALLGMARAFARAGDAQRAQDAYNAVRKRHSREEVEQVFRRFDERERLKRQPPNDEDDSDDE
ncbi:MAG: hypothetical protein OXT69_00150 [Candidatus Poribacteria bacterium]|nr:hypothetical protein [Candidatus Poribacteria bacterium]